MYIRIMQGSFKVIIIVGMFLDFREIGECFQELNEDSKCRAVVLSGAGKIFTAGKLLYMIVF